MSANFTELKPFRYWCQKVLPLVYDDTLSYYELLCKVVDYLNKTMEDVDTLHTDVENLYQAYVELQGFVNNYFDNLDVQEEIDNKLDSMVEDGTLTELLSAYMPNLIKIYNSLSDMRGDAGLIAGQLCFVNGLCYEDFDSYNIYFDVIESDNPRADEYIAIELDNGLVAVPNMDGLKKELSSNTPETQAEIISTALSYCDRSDFVYGHDTLFAETCVMDANDKYDIDCSSLTQAALMGIRYENSRYVNGTNTENGQEPWGYKFSKTGLPSSPIDPVARKYGYLANELAFYFYSHGLLYEINEDGSNVQAGDIVFEYTDDYEHYSTYFNLITHCAVVMQNMRNGTIRIIEAGNGAWEEETNPIIANYVCAIRTYVCGGNHSFKWGARIPVVSCNNRLNNIVPLRNTIPSTISKGISKFTTFHFGIDLNEKLKKGEMYTFEISGDFSDLKEKLTTANFKLIAKVDIINTSNTVLQELSMTDVNSLLQHTGICFTYTPLRNYDTTNRVHIYLLTDSSVEINSSVTIDCVKVWSNNAPHNMGKPTIALSQTLTNTTLMQKDKLVYAGFIVPAIQSGEVETVIGTIDIYNDLYDRLKCETLPYSVTGLLAYFCYIRRGEIVLYTNYTGNVTNVRFAISFNLNDY